MTQQLDFLSSALINEFWVEVPIYILKIKKSEGFALFCYVQFVTILIQLKHSFAEQM